MTEDQKDRQEPSVDGAEVRACPDSECKDAPFAGMHFTGDYSAQGERYYREFDGGCPWASKARNRDLAGSVADLLEKFQREATDSGALTYAAEIVRLVREQVAREILAERHHLTTGMYPADARWLRALDTASVIATHGASS